MSADHGWTDLLDPEPDEVRRSSPADLHPRAVDELFRRAGDTAARPTIEGHGDYVFGQLLVPVVTAKGEDFYLQEVLFVLTREKVLTVRKTPPAGAPWDPTPVQDVCSMRDRVAPGMIAFHIVDEVAEHYLDLLDALDDHVDELEERVDDWSARDVQRRLSELRHDVIQIRRTLAPTRDAVRSVVDGRTDIEGRPLFRREVFPADVELHFGQAYDKLLRATEGLDFSRDLIVGVREYHQSLVANEQNRVTKTLTVIASLLLFPTFIVGVYGQNFRNMPELGWRLGYGLSWALIALVTIAQLAFFRWKRWI